MGKVRVSAFSVSLDGFAAGPGQDLQHPFGLGADEVPGAAAPNRLVPGFYAVVDHGMTYFGVERGAALQLPRCAACRELPRSIFL